MPLSLLLAVIILVVIFLWLRQRRRQIPSSRRQSFKQSGVRAGTRRQLLRMVGGNPAVAHRLVERVRERYPNRSEQWCWEKAIYDIQRDRRS